MPKISVLMPVYNAQDYLSEAIDSILSQTFSDWELIIINDGSTDNSENIINSYNDNRIRYFKNPTNMGLIYTRSLMIEKASAEYLSFLDSDDIALPERLKIQAEFLDTHPDYILCGTWGTMINNASEKIGKISPPEADIEIKSGLFFSNAFIQSSIMIRKSVFDTYSYNKDFPVVEDYELWSKLSINHKLKNIPQPLTLYRWHSENTSLSKKELMETMLKNVYLNQLSRLQIRPSQEELSVHLAIRDKETQNISDKEFFKRLAPWLKKLAKANDKHHVLDRNTFLAIICFRWIFACQKRKAYSRILLFPVCLNIKALGKLTKLIADRIK